MSRVVGYSQTCTRCKLHPSFHRLRLSRKFYTASANCKRIFVGLVVHTPYNLITTLLFFFLRAMYSVIFTAKFVNGTLAPSLSQVIEGAGVAGAPALAPAAPTATVPFHSGGLVQTRSVSQLTGTLRLLRDRSVSLASAQGRSRTVLVPAVPSVLGASDLCAFFGSLLPSIEHMRFLRTDGVPGRYAVLLRFSTQEAADRCFRGYNGRPFSSLLDPGVVCRALFVGSARVEWAGEGPPPGLLENDALRLDSEASVQWSPETPASASAPQLVELPSCPVCLERLDSSASGLLTTLCQHSFHSDCLSRWAGSDTCPVCRYCMWQDDTEAHLGGAGGGGEAASAADDAEATGGGLTGGGVAAAVAPGDTGSGGSPRSSTARAAPATGADADMAEAEGAGVGAGGSAGCTPSTLQQAQVEDALLNLGGAGPGGSAAESGSRSLFLSHRVSCESCGVFSDLWMCLVCGCVGCGRYTRKHQIEHWKTSGHCYAIELNSQRVWDYASDWCVGVPAGPSFPLCATLALES